MPAQKRTARRASEHDSLPADAITNQTAGSAASVSQIETIISNPPTQQEVTDIVAKIGELINALQRAS